MTNYGWFAIKGIVMIGVVGLAVYVTNTGWPLWALLLFPDYSDGDKK